MKWAVSGPPWFMTLFGRDSLHHLVGWRSLVDPDLALGSPCKDPGPASRARRSTPRNEEEPGRILHEMRLRR